MIPIAIAMLMAAWLIVAAVVVGLCASAAAGDRALLQTLPRRRTWRAVRSRSLRSSHSDQLATYR
jgi:hypothetical protein